MNLSEYREILGQRINKQSASSTFNTDLDDEISLACITHANNAYRWSELRQKDSLSLIASQSEYFIPTYNNMDTIIQMWHEEFDNICPIKIVSHNKFYKSGLSTTDTRNEPYFALIEQRVGVYTQPSSASTLTVSSSSSSDTGIATRVYGVVGGMPDFETITTNGTDGTIGVSGTKSFSQVYGFSKNESTTGILTLSAVPTTIAQISAGAQTKECRYTSIKFYPIPASTTTIYYYYKRKQPKLIDDKDFSILSDDHDNAILLYAEYLVTREPKTMAFYEAALKELIAKEPAVMDEEICFEKRFSNYPKYEFAVKLGDHYETAT